MVVRRAGLDLPPAAAWLLLRISDEPAIDVRSTARRYGLDQDRIEAGLAELLNRGLIASAGERFELTPAGCEVFDRLAAARRERLVELREQWPPEQRQQLADILQRLARELVPPRAT